MWATPEAMLWVVRARLQLSAASSGLTEVYPGAGAGVGIQFDTVVVGPATSRAILSAPRATAAAAADHQTQKYLLRLFRIWIIDN